MTGVEQIKLATAVIGFLKSVIGLFKSDGSSHCIDDVDEYQVLHFLWRNGACSGFYIRRRLKPCGLSSSRTNRALEHWLKHGYIVSGWWAYDLTEKGQRDAGQRIWS